MRLSRYQSTNRPSVSWPHAASTSLQYAGTLTFSRSRQNGLDAEWCRRPVLTPQQVQSRGNRKRG
jgi:hypothetical protein